MMFIKNDVLMGDDTNSDDDEDVDEDSDDDILEDGADITRSSAYYQHAPPATHQQQQSSHLSHNNIILDEYTGHVIEKLAASGPAGISAATAISSITKKSGGDTNRYKFEINPSLRKRIQTRLLRKMKALVEEYSARVGQQMAILLVSPGKPSMFKCYGTSPLDLVLSLSQATILSDLEDALEHTAAATGVKGGGVGGAAAAVSRAAGAECDLPPLIFDGIPTSVDKMTQSQLRAFIPILLKYSTGRGKPGWGKAACRPAWWPHHVPWLNVRSDNRSEEDKARVSWTEALRMIVVNCYKHHKCQHLLNAFPPASTSTTSHHRRRPPPRPQDSQTPPAVSGRRQALVGGGTPSEQQQAGPVPSTETSQAVGGHHTSPPSVFPPTHYCYMVGHNTPTSTTSLPPQPLTLSKEALSSAGPQQIEVQVSHLPLTAAHLAKAGTGSVPAGAALHPAVVHIPLSVYNSLSACQQHSLVVPGHTTEPPPT